jgi:hypothetical protein
LAVVKNRIYGGKGGRADSFFCGFKQAMNRYFCSRRQQHAGAKLKLWKPDFFFWLYMITNSMYLWPQAARYECEVSGLA